ncbi:MAG TPA: CPBP family intramembrane glutamic endopeptidase [Bacillota bacterium]|nr:CPBP family intramembrane glutamic endopeptidase [Bacillota bacterium]
MNKRYWWVIITYIIMQLSSIPVAFVLKYLTTFSNETNSTILIGWTIFSFIAALVVILILMRPFMKVESNRDRPNIFALIGWAILGLIMAFASQIIVSALELTLFGIEPGSENTFEIMDIARAAPLFIIVPALVGPILEEIIFRKIIFGSLYKRMNFFLAALISSLIFGIIHMEPEHLLLYAAMGFVFAFVYVMTKRIMVPIIVHMSMNSIAVMLQFSLTPEDIEKMREQMEQIQMILIGG